jgi:predicted Zn-dependent peptidase
MAGWSPQYFDGDNIYQDQTHHYAGLFFMGYFGGGAFGNFVNDFRDNNVTYYNDGDTDLGRLAVSQGADFQALNMTPNDLAAQLDALRPPWRR